MANVLLLHWGRDAGRVREELRTRGHEVVLEARQGGSAWNAIRSERYQVCVISLDEHPHIALTAADATRTGRLRGVPLILVGGDRATLERALERFPEASYTTWDQLAEVVEDVTPLETTRPELRPF